MSIKVYKQLADTHYQLADLYTQLAAEEAIADSASGPERPARQEAAAGTAAPASFSDGTPIDEPEEWTEFAPQPLPAAGEPSGDQGFDAICPKHRVAYTDGRYGPYCTRQTDDPAWAKVKPDGKMFCKITPKNAAEYLRIRAAA